jgi:hypothetical protein
MEHIHAEFIGWWIGQQRHLAEVHLKHVNNAKRKNIFGKLLLAVHFSRRHI